MNFIRLLVGWIVAISLVAAVFADKPWESMAYLGCAILTAGIYTWAHVSRKLP